MAMKVKFSMVPVAGLIILGGPAYGKVYLSLEQAQATLFPGATFTRDFRTLTAEQAKQVEKASGVDVRDKQLKAWKASTGGWFIADEVVGKHDYIPIALALDGNGAVKGIEILEYREAYGDQVRNAAWRAQFNGKHPGDKLKLGDAIHNISGATLSCRHITDGIDRLLATYAIVLAPNR